MSAHAGGDRSQLQDFLSKLEDGGELCRVHDEVSVHEISALIAANDRAVLIEHVRGYDMPVAANLLASRRAWAIALGVPDDGVIAEISRRLESHIPPREVTESGLHDVVCTGDAIDVTELPAYLQHDADGGPYISAALDVSTSPTTGAVNLGVRRLMVRARNETGVDVVAPSDLRAYYTDARKRGQRFEVAFVVGGHPMDYLASQLKVGSTDDWALAGALRAEPVPLVRCRTIDVQVPADADIVLEGYFSGEWTEIEGPYGEYHGSLGPPHRNPIYKLTAVTRRRSAVFQSATIGNPSLAHTDTAMIGALKCEMMIWSALQRSIAMPLDVYCPPAAGGRHHARIKIVNRDPGDSRNALLAALACQADIKQALVVDEDVDIRDDHAVEWAVSTRFQAATDAVVVDGLRTLPLEPSLEKGRPGGVVTSKLGIDATRRRGVPATVFDASRAVDASTISESTRSAVPAGRPPEARLREVLGSPRQFKEIVDLMDGVHLRDLLAALGSLRSAGIVRVDDEGKYTVSASIEDNTKRPRQDDHLD